jgi:hypothetical protein
MTDKPKIYLETTMFSFYYGRERAPEYRQYKAEAGAVFGLINNLALKGEVCCSAR